jgi:hypothetical protein
MSAEKWHRINHSLGWGSRSAHPPFDVSNKQMDIRCVRLDMKSVDHTARVIFKRLGVASSAVKADIFTDPDQADLKCWIGLGRLRDQIEILVEFSNGLFPLGRFCVGGGSLVLHSQNRVAHAISKSLHGYVWRLGAIVHRFPHYHPITLREGEVVQKYRGP